MAFTKFLRLFHTIRHLKFRQIVYRLVYLFYKGRISLRSLSLAIREPLRQPQEFLARANGLVGPQNFFFLNKEGSLDDVGWQGGGMTKLWRYNQHYFDFLNSIKFPEQKDWELELLLDWVSKNSPGQGDGWEPYPTSLRIVNWIKWILSGNTLPIECKASLAAQTAWLSSRIEYHILGNHLFANGKALVFAGTFFEGQEADQWLNKGLKIISIELQEQVLSDGANFELSPMYHCIFLEDLLDLIHLAQIFPNRVSEEIVDEWGSKANQMISWMESMTHPDGDIALFNDAAFGIASKPQNIIDYAQRLAVTETRNLSPVNLTRLEASGYLRLEDKDQVLIIDVAKVGPDYLPGHAHADTLSFELSLFGERIFVNGGTSEYGSGVVRQYERSTAAHNTVVVDQKDSSEVWAGFRVARRAYPVDLQIKHSNGESTIACLHNGYERLRRGLRHKREWRSSRGYLRINDAVKGKFSDAFAYYHLSPDVLITSVKSSKISLKTKGEKTICLDLLCASFEISDGYYSPEFGKRIPNKCLKIQLDKLKGASVLISWNQ